MPLSYLVTHTQNPIRMLSNSLSCALVAWVLCLSWYPPDLFGGDSCCEDFDHPVMLEFMYLGDDCGASLHSQSSSDCDDFGSGPNNHSEVFVKICANEHYRNPDNVWKTSMANLGSSFFFTNRDVGSDYIPEWTHIFIFNNTSEEILLQHIVLQSSCEVPLELNDQWGSLRLIGMEGAYGGYCGTGTATLLPLSFVYFSADQEGQTVAVNWGVSGELFEGKMEVQRSDRGRYFNAIATIAASGVSGLSDYEFVDQHPFPYENYYRLKIFNEDGSATYSQIEMVEYTFHGRTSLFPNPVIDKLRIAGANKLYDIEVINVMGSRESAVIISADYSAVDFSNLPSGVYYVVLYGAHGKTVQQVMKS